uniref:Tumor necrosis factor ligand superfamily member 10-like n=1 Tax=Saccoglossus kowalevskii TaxID=10224 RepID=A0ABM0MQ63_SACKO|nr:PREDICTED: tumor necrosis factor ligand superfamily member 10-like [Saccoglossus kowalevskii]
MVTWLTATFLIAHYQNQISSLELRIEHLEEPRNTIKLLAESQIPQRPTGDPDTETGCRCGPTATGTAVSGSDALSNQGILPCCGVSEETLQTVISKILSKKKNFYQQEHRRRSELSIEQIERLIEDIVAKNNTLNLRHAPRLRERTVLPRAIHVTGKTNGFSGITNAHRRNRNIKVGPWEAVYGRSLQKNVQCDQYNIIVPESGIYYVYSQAYFRDEELDSAPSSPDIMEYLHYTVLESTAYEADPINLMKSGKTQRKNSDYYYSSFHSGLFELRAGDRLYMKVYLPTRATIDCQQESTFMGMFLVSGLGIEELVM